MMNIASPRAMWDELKSSHLLNSSGTRYYYLRSLMGLAVADEDGIKDYLLLINDIGSSLNKICIYGKISIEDIKITALTSSLPSLFNSVISHFKRQPEVNYKAVSDAVRGAVVNNKNRSSQSNLPSVASLAKITSSSNPKARAGRDNNRSQRREGYSSTMWTL